MGRSSRSDSCQPIAALHRLGRTLPFPSRFFFRLFRILFFGWFLLVTSLFRQRLALFRFANFSVVLTTPFVYFF